MKNTLELGRLHLSVATSGDWKEFALGVIIHSNWNRNTCRDDGLDGGFSHHSLTISLLWVRLYASILL